MKEKLLWISTREKIGFITFKRLMKYFGSIENLYKAQKDE